ncbi:glycosyl transferase [candidate division WOR-1 bacterium RIFOXYA12_FULL_43_27]|uniref:Glycosyl transferase n=1 Tax=candidate division WOR-1 bacterium RIFOXYC2_FULL_46_14 TaxID=1802587 RepID=A0A1F4U5Z8_UNCSA|nr:MAG: glycosyl transferase [candidate division WOR-1 bacterium RIFOXYA12_FULL_43_27]OGC20553.1 MAG: glycosyl transferase [candidate division WOR-1 bacterium RIFOXYB2_FULL_46_45]OGC31710.1 MAG: glycosyl transferase [candidate division WOR-1 bacterium RIFOXYA2_FULL_46_56]OGC40395.1 MAG: glycosyl transferase [candidate division WOR-1 bacterium RIFOXYC2_FULL_46_14]
MKFGYFDNKEYVITRPDTPVPWINYIGGGEYGGIVSNTGGGYSFDSDPKNKRILRYRYNAIPMDQPGRYIYIRDEKSKKFWSATWQPICEKLDSYECRNGMGYTKVKSSKFKVQSEITYFVPGAEHLEIWMVKVKNNDKKSRTLKLFTYAEFSFYDAIKDQTNLDWTQQIQQGTFEKNTILWTSFMKTQGYTFFSSSEKFDSFDTRRGAFVGRYRGLEKPLAVEKGKCSNSIALRGNGCAGTCKKITLKPKEEKIIVYVLGTAKEPREAFPLIEKYTRIETVESAFEALNNYWDNYVSHFQIKTPDKEMDEMVNLWNQYQCKSTFNWSRFVSMYQLGVNRGMGFRDSAQDTMGVMHTIPYEAKALIKKLFKIQFKDGMAYHQFYPLTGEGSCGDAEEGAKVCAKWYSDDHLWAILSSCSFIKETGETIFLREEVPFVDQEKATVFDHLKATIDFSVKHTGEHGLCLAGWADWNDTINLDTGKGRSESVFTTMLLGYALNEMIDLCKFIGEHELVQKYKQHYEHFKKIVNSAAWDGGWYLRAYDDEMQKLGSKECEKGQIFLEPQPWAVMAGFADGERAKETLQNVYDLMNTKYGIVLMYPSYDGFDWRKGGVTTYPPGAKENGGIFVHANPWVIVAEAKMKNCQRAFQYYKQILPSTRNEIADLYEVEPYVYCQNILGKEHPQFGLGRNSWLTGAAAWNFVAASQWILGIRPDYHGLIIDPAIPATWKQFKVKRVFRGSVYEITVKNPKKKSCGVKHLVVDGKKLNGNIAPIFDDKATHKIEAILG